MTGASVELTISSALTPVLVGLMLLAAPVLVVARLWLTIRQEQAARAFAARIGWRWVGTDPSLVDRWRRTPFGTGSQRRATQVMTGAFGPYQALSFAYRYTTGSGKNRQSHVVHVVGMGLPAFLPDLDLSPDGVLARLSAFGRGDLDLESEEFNKRWRVEAPDPRFAHAVLHPRLMERLVRDDATGMSIRVQGTDILSLTGGEPDLDQLARRLGVLRAVVDSVPRFVWLDHGYDPVTP